MNREQKERKLELRKEKLKRKSKDNFCAFCHYIDRNMEWTDFHKTYYKILYLFAQGKIKKLMISVPPQHGKSEGSTRKLPAYLVGIAPDKNIAIGSYNDTFAKKFVRQVKKIINSEEYKDIFNIELPGMKHTEINTASEFEILNHKGNVKGVGRGGGITGNKVDIMIMDDIFKSYKEGNSPVIRQEVKDWYRDDVRSRYHNDTQEIMVFTRWHEDDLIGFVGEIEKIIEPETWGDLENVPEDTWVKLNFQAIKENDPTELDPRDIDDVLWDNRHSYKKLTDTKRLNPERFGSLYQGDPIPREGMLWDVDKFKTYKAIPVGGKRRNRTDTADTGTDFLCSFNYVEFENDAYIINALLTQDGMEITEKQMALMLDADNIKFTRIEANNGGQGFSRNVKKYCKFSHGIEAFHQGENKESRIHTESANVQNNIIWPEDWMYKWPEVYQAVKSYRKNFKSNKTDDVADTMTGIIEDINKPSTKIIGYRNRD